MNATIALEHLVTLQVGWNTYETLIAEVQDAAGHRIAYDGDTLEIMTPSTDHERYNRLLEGLVQILALEWRIPLESVGSTTLKRKPRGAEPDSAFYIQNAAAKSAKNDIVLGVDPPPDLVVEIDLSRERIDKAKMYAELGILEFWRYDGIALRAYALIDDTYHQIQESRVLSGLRISILNGLLERRGSSAQSTIRNAWQKWLRSARRDAG